MEGKKYPTEIDEIRAEAERSCNSVIEIERGAMRNLKEHCAKETEELIVAHGLQYPNEILGAVAMEGRQKGIPESVRASCARAFSRMQPYIADMDVLFMSWGARCMKTTGDTTHFEGINPENPLVRRHLIEPIRVLYRGLPAHEKECKLEAKVQEALDYWFSDVSDVLLSTIPSEDLPEDAKFEPDIEKAYNESSRHTVNNFELCNGRDGMGIITRCADIRPGDTVAVAMTSGGWPLPHIARYKPKKIYASNIAECRCPRKIIAGVVKSGTPIEAVEDFYSFGGTADITICPYAQFFDRHLVRKAAERSRRGAAFGTVVVGPAHQYRNRGPLEEFGDEKCRVSFANMEPKRLERELGGYFKNVRVSQYDGWFIVSAHDKR